MTNTTQVTKKVLDDGLSQKDFIGNMMLNYTNNSRENADYVAFDFLDNDPLNDNSVESLTTQVEIWLEQSKAKQRELEEKLLDVRDEFNCIMLRFKENFILDLNELW